MSRLTYAEKQLFEKIFEMEGGYLLDFSNSTLQEFMNDFEIDLGNHKYDKYGSSKAKRIRAFWEIESDKIVIPVLEGLLENANQNREVGIKDNELALRCINRIKGNEENRNEVQGLASAEESIISHRIWSDGIFRVFLSHKSEFMRETAILKEELSFYGMSCFVAHEDIAPTRLWQDEIENALHSMDVLVALMTEEFQDSSWTDQEIGFAMGRKKPIVSVRMGTDPYGFIGKYQGVATNWESAPFEIIKILMSQEKMIDAYLEKLKVCNSFDKANKFGKCLPFMENLTRAQVDAFISIFDENDQVKSSHSFNGQKPQEFGQGLAFHLSRVMGENYRLTDEYKIMKG